MLPIPCGRQPRLGRGRVLCAVAGREWKSVPAINQFSQRNAPEIATRRQVLLAQVDAEAAHLWISDKVTRRAWRQKMIEDMEVALADPDLDWRQRSLFNRDIAMLLHQVDEEKGELPPRTSKVEVTF